MKMFNWFALGLVLVIAVLGLIFVGLGVFDVKEAFDLHWPLTLINAACVAAIIVPVACIAAWSFAITGSSPVLWLGGGVLAFAAGSLLRGWLAGQELNTAITVLDITTLIASVLHLIGASLGLSRLHLPEPESRRKPGIMFFYYLGILAIITLVTLLAHRGMIPPFSVSGTSSTLLRDIIRGTAATLFLASFCIYLKIYFKSRTIFFYWYSLGLMLFALGTVFISLSPVDSQIAWLGRISQYAGSIYFLVTVLGLHRLATARKMRVNQSG